MKEDGIDISTNPVKDVFDFFKEGKIFHYIITDPQGVLFLYEKLFPDKHCHYLMCFLIGNSS
jgi:hypothetical protein